MVVANHQTATAEYEFILRPNCSLSWQATKVFFVLMCAVSFSIASMFALMGAWLVFPFAGIEMLALGAGLYACAWRATRFEVISIRGDDVKVAKGRRSITEEWRLPRHWAQVRLDLPRHQWYPTRLRILSHGKGVEVGDYLNEEEREALAGDLRKALQI